MTSGILDMIKTIAVLCQIHPVGTAINTDIYSKNQLLINAARVTDNTQKECHRYYADCLSKANTYVDTLNCLKERK